MDRTALPVVDWRAQATMNLRPTRWPAPTLAGDDQVDGHAIAGEVDCPLCPVAPPIPKMIEAICAMQAKGLQEPKVNVVV